MSEDAPTAGEGRDDNDDGFDAIVASFHAPSAPQAGSDHLADPPAEGALASVPSPAGGGWDDVVTDLEAREAARRPTEEEPPEVEERYVPPPPPPLPRSDALGTAAWIGAIGAPVVWMLLSLLGWPFESWQLLLLVAVFLGSFGVLVSRMRQGPGEDDPDDNGAVV